MHDDMHRRRQPRRSAAADTAGAESLGKSRWLGPTIVLGLIFACALLVNAWIVDDAYITFRTVDNFVNGHGLTWNVDERVQAYTHPLWMFVVSLVYLGTSELFFSVIILSFLLTLAAVGVVSRAATGGFRATPWKPALLIVALLSSKAFVDFASSGLENALSYLIAAVFCTRLLASGRQSWRERHVLELFLVASAGFLNRSDTVLLYLPALLYALFSARSLAKWRLARAMFLGTLPAILWVLFSLLYYGFVFPNTAYAKMLSTGFPDSWRLAVGLEYLAISLAGDSASFLVMVAALWCAFKRRSAEGGALLGGVLLYVVYVVATAASATHMSGRFFAVPFFISIVLFVEWADRRRSALVAGGMLAVYLVWSPVSSLKFGTPFYRPHPHPRFFDTKWLAKAEGAALLNWRPGKSLPDHPWLHYGYQLRRLPERIHVGGALGGEPVGYVGFAAGPEKHIIDVLALTDPLLARLPAIKPPNMVEWRPGHFRRAIPDGYVASVAARGNLIVDHNIGHYYDLLVIITRGPLFSAERLGAIWTMNRGGHRGMMGDDPD